MPDPGGKVADGPALLTGSDLQAWRNWRWILLRSPSELQEVIALEGVKSSSPTTENWLRKLCTYSMNINTSDEDNKHDTNYINKYKYTNTYTRKLHNL